MIWFILGIFTAFFEAVKDVFRKQNLKKNDEYVVAWSLAFFSAVFLVPLILYAGVSNNGIFQCFRSHYLRNKILTTNLFTNIC